MSENLPPHPIPPLEDTWLDIVDKARAGQGLDVGALCAKAGISRRDWDALARAPTPDAGILAGIATALGINPRGLLMIAQGKYLPDVAEIPGLRQIPTPFPLPGWALGTANAYVVRAPDSNIAAVFDTGTGADEIIRYLEANALRIGHLFITHGHGDHTGGLAQLHSLYPRCPVTYGNAATAPNYARRTADGEMFPIGALIVEVRHTPGHTDDGASYYVQGLARPAVFVGDALFAGSAGRAGNWTAALEAMRTRILSLPAETVVCPGHGPLTTVRYETAHNPLFCE